jgi:ORF6N domain-containing protein
MLDYDLAALYDVKTGALNRAVKRNRDRFPDDFMFQVGEDEWERLRCQIGISNKGATPSRSGLKFQIGTSNRRRGGRRYLPYAFTEQGVAMLSSVLRSPRAVQVKLAALERKYDTQFKVVFDAIRELMTPPEKPKRSIGFHS